MQRPTWLGGKGNSEQGPFNPDEGYNADMYMKISDLTNKLNNAFPGPIEWNDKDSQNYQAMAHKILSDEGRNYTLNEFVKDHNVGAEKRHAVFHRTKQYD